MQKTMLFAGALLASGLGAATTAASAQGWREPVVSCASGAIGCNSGAYSGVRDGGLGRYCPPGYYPHAWPNGDGVRCEPPGDTTTFISPY